MFPAQKPRIRIGETANLDGAVRPVRRHRRLRRLAVVALSAVAALGVAVPAGADPFGLDTPTFNEPGVGAIPDNFDHTYCFDGPGWTASHMSVVHTQMVNLDTQTSYFDTFPPQPPCFEQTDLWFQVTVLPAGTRGDWSCRWWGLGADGLANTGDERCASALIRMSSDPAVLTSDHQRRKTICHEIGHSVGLAHGTDTTTFWDDCMVSGVVPNGIMWEQYNAHHIAHANSRTPQA